jgi:hypothetical protein
MTMPPDRTRLVAVLGASFPSLRDNLPTLDLWTAELVGTGLPADVLERGIVAHAHGSEWPSLAGIIGEARRIAADDAMGQSALPERAWSPEDEAAARDAFSAAMSAWKARRSSETAQAVAVRERMETPGEDWFAEHAQSAQDRRGDTAEADGPSDGLEDSGAVSEARVDGEDGTP